MLVKNDYDACELYDVLWGNAKRNMDEAIEKGYGTAVMNCLDEMFCGDVPTLTDVNDVLSYDFDTVKSYIGMVDEDEESEDEE